MSHYKPYPKYKDSGVEWLGRVPEHWEIKKILYWISGYGSGTTPSLETDYTDDGIPWVTTSELRENTIIKTEKCVTSSSLSSYSALKVHPLGSLVIAMYGATVGRLGLLGIAVALNQACFAIHPCDHIRIHFLRWWFEGFRNELIALASGAGQPNISGDKIRNLILAAPPEIVEQDQLAAFLDRETTRIDALISKKTRFIELLREKRQALITHAVTKGLDPNVNMKDSGVEWLGKVPEHWMTMSLARVAISRCDGPFGSSIKSEHYVDKGVRVVRLQNIGLGFFKDDDKAFLDIDYCRKELGGGHNVIAGDLLMGGLGDENNPLGRACIAPELIGPAIVKADCYRFRLDTKKVIPIFIGLQLSATARVECGFISTGATRERLNLGLAAGRVIAIPPTLHEQTKIVRYVKDWQGRIDKIVLKTNRSIDLLKERRAALITAAVTGQIDVRETA